MKKHTHPNSVKTLIQFKDGSSYTKKWLFFRSNLQLEVEYASHPFWKKESVEKNKKKNANNTSVN